MVESSVFKGFVQLPRFLVSAYGVYGLDSCGVEGFGETKTLGDSLEHVLVGGCFDEFLVFVVGSFCVPS